MERIHEELFMVFLRHGSSHAHHPDRAERPLLLCSSYAEARRIQREFRHTARDCIIRYVGPAGGGD